MRIATVFAAVASASLAVASSSWLSKGAYNKWHETELERWLSDHNVPYPTPADRRDLQKLVEKNWDNYVVSPYNSWGTDQLAAYLKLKGVQAQDTASLSKDALVAQVQDTWYETGDQAQSAYGSIKDWILDTWTESQLKTFCDKHGIPVPQPRKRDTLLQKIRSNYDTVAKKAGQASAYPGDWLYESWTESDLKEWLDSHGFPAPQPTSRDKLIASVRRNSRLAYLKMQDQSASASSSAKHAYQTLSDMVIDGWTDSQLKEFCDKNSIPVPQGSKAEELRALVRKHRANILGDTASGTAASAFGAATSRAGNEYSKATDSASLAAKDAFYKAVDTWSESRLKAYLDARGIPVPQASKTDELRALVRKHSHTAATTWNSVFQDMSYDNLKNYIQTYGDAAAKKVADKSSASRDDLVSAAGSVYASASSAGGNSYASVTSFISQSTAAAKKSLFEGWSESELKSYLDSYGPSSPQPSNLDELRAAARKQYTYFKYGTTTPSETVMANIEESLKDGWNWVKEQLHIGADAAKKQAAEAEKKAKETKEEL